MKANFRCWLENEQGEQIVGPGLYRLLTEVKKSGSLSQAAREMNMSYRTAWGKIKKIEERVGTEVIEKKVGGKDGGGSELTSKGYQLMEMYNQLKASLENALKDLEEA
ncbi:MAG: winged helix-turn-helix domain-containing protein [Halarsenatibacteraceae bacterium]